MNFLTNVAMEFFVAAECFARPRLLGFISGHRWLTGLMNLLMLLDYNSFLTKGVNALKVVIIAVGGGLAILGVVNLLEGYGNDNPGAKSQGMKQFMAGAGVMLIGALLVPELTILIPDKLSDK